MPAPVCCHASSPHIHVSARVVVRCKNKTTATTMKKEETIMTILRRLTSIAISLVICATLTGWSSNGVQSAPTTAKAYFAGGCFWCMEEAFEKVDGVLAAVSGYMGGSVANPTYEEVSAGRTGHAEAVEVTYDPTKVTYQKLLDAFWRNIDPVTPNAQFCDHGTQYRAAIFYSTDEEKRFSE